MRPDFDDSAAYAFTDIDPWNSSHTGMAPPPAIGDLTGEVAPGFNGAGLTINSATSLGEGGGLCPTNYLGWEADLHDDGNGVRARCLRRAHRGTG